MWLHAHMTIITSHMLQGGVVTCSHDNHQVTCFKGVWLHAHMTIITSHMLQGGVVTCSHDKSHDCSYLVAAPRTSQSLQTRGCPSR